MLTMLVPSTRRCRRCKFEHACASDVENYAFYIQKFETMFFRLPAVCLRATSSTRSGLRVANLLIK